MENVATDQSTGKHVFENPLKHFHDLTHLTTPMELLQHFARVSWVVIVSLARLSQGERKYLSGVTAEKIHINHKQLFC